MTLQPLITLNT